MKKIIAMDLDGVLVDFLWGFTAKGKEMFGAPVRKTHEQKSWDEFEGLDSEQIGMIWRYIKASPNFWRMLERCVPEYVMGSVSELALHEGVYFVTSRPGYRAKQQTEGWLRDHGIVNPTVVISGEKGTAIQALKATHYIDDKAGNAVFAKYRNPLCDVYLLDRLYNRFDHTVVGSKVKRVASVEEFLKEVTGE